MGGAQVPPDQTGVATSPNVQEADEGVAGATVSLDKLTLQPDFPYGDSQQSDEIGIDSPDFSYNDDKHTGSYLPAQSMAPRISK